MKPRRRTTNYNRDATATRAESSVGIVAHNSGDGQLDNHSSMGKDVRSSNREDVEEILIMTIQKSDVWAQKKQLEELLSGIYSLNRRD